MVIFKHIKDLQQYLKSQSHPIGFVPTMGALHAGHISLLGTAKQAGNLTVCSIFVNPTQFNDKEDFEKYPVTIDEDIELLLNAGCDVLFLPSVAEVYPAGFTETRAYDFGYLETILEGAQRPGHFRGVGQVVGRLLEAVQPQYLYMGQKDYQQCMVVKKLLELMELDKAIRLVIGNTVREADGLAMSSRNRRLNDAQRIVASTIYQCLVSIQGKQDASFPVAQQQCLDILTDKGFIPEYVSLADAKTLELLPQYSSGRKMVALIAAKLGPVRLIDNMLLN